MNILRKFFAFLRLREAVRMADNAHRHTRQRYYVMPQHGSRGRKLVVMDRYNFRRLKMKHYIHQDARVFDLMRECFYFTPNRSGNQILSPADRRKKVLQYFAWVDADRKATNAKVKASKKAMKAK